MPSIIRRAGLLCVAFLCLVTDLRPVRAASAAPDTMQGFLRYKVRGLSAVQGGILSGVLMGAATHAGMQTAALNSLRLVLGGAAKLSDNPGMAEFHDFLTTGKGIDFSGAPVSAGYDVELDFVLQSDGKGSYRLKSGNARYSGNTDSDLTLSGDGGNTHRLTDRYRGMGSVALTPEHGSITLTMSGEGDDRRVHFDVNVSFPVTLVGKSTWSMMGGQTVITLEDKGDVSTTGLTMFGQRYEDSNPQNQPYAGASYGRSGPIDSVLRGRETWQDLTDSGVLVEWELWDVCSARIETPEYFDELTFDQTTTGRIHRIAKADVQPTYWDQDLHWSFMPMSGSEIEPPPSRANGNDFDVTYSKLPPRNSSFGRWMMKAEFDTDRARRAGCKNPDPHEISYHFARTAENNPGPNARDAAAKGSGPDPNWFFYWNQTAAAVGRAKATKYGGSSASACAEKNVGGYYALGTSHIVVCDLARDWGFRFVHPWVDFATDGIDTYAAVVLHEWKHHDDYQQWWPKGYSATLDSDNDLIPDLLEPTTEVPVPLNGRHKHFDNDVKDTLGLGFGDEHYFAYMAMADWNRGSADHEDWSCPGHQASEECASPG